MAYSISNINQMTQTEFVTAFGDVFEDTPSLAEQTWHHCPFTDLAHLHQTMVTLVDQLSPDAQLVLIRAHPDLGSRVHMAPASVQEQTGVGLNNLSAAEYKKFQILNKSYQTKFGFPFIMAVKGQTKEAILTAFDRRLQNSPAHEQQQAILEIVKIAHFRLNDLIA
ncbi:MAG: 2-oxo-4-hydroxy-4-carboxy-5-ureidoimidazoline decarboxylase [Leptolyngbyaceae cyanobacterium]